MLLNLLKYFNLVCASIPKMNSMSKFKNFSQLLYLCQYALNQFPLAKFSFSIKRLPPGGAPSNDLITNRILKNLSLKTLSFLTNIYNVMLKLSHFPKIWKFAVIIIIHKPDKSKHLSSLYDLLVYCQFLEDSLKMPS